MWVLPQGARFANEKTYNLIRGEDFKSGSYYRLILLASHLFAMVGMVGEVRYCSQTWAREQAQLKRMDELPFAVEVCEDDYPEVEAIESQEFAG